MAEYGKKAGEKVKEALNERKRGELKSGKSGRKHFKWEPRGKRRIHKTPTQKEVEACRRWLIAEIEAVDPACIVCLGATAGKAVLGHAVRIGALRGAPQVHPAWPQRRVTLTYHPAFVLRQRDPERMTSAYGELVADLTAAARLLIAMR